MKRDRAEPDSSDNVPSDIQHSKWETGKRRCHLTVSVSSLNNTLVCPLCLGYYRDAYAIAECLHTCKCKCSDTFIQVYYLMTYIYIYTHLRTFLCTNILYIGKNISFLVSLQDLPPSIFVESKHDPH